MNRVNIARQRSTTRLGVVQALYQIETAGELPILVIDEFLQYRLDSEIEGVEYVQADPSFFADVVAGVHKRLLEIDALIGESLSGGWQIDRLDRTVRQILRAGTYELLARIDVPPGAVINEYVDIAHAFFENGEPGFVNGVLDHLANEVRSKTAVVCSGL